jgi:iron complex outermembrane receptor protein
MAHCALRKLPPDPALTLADARGLAALLACACLANVARAQHASDNPIAAAEDAFGLTLGLESIGMYGPGSVRGFNPQSAGNVRLDGLYFDQQNGLSNRVVEGSTIRVGVSEIGYAFPAPTGIVDYDLRHTGDGTPSASLVANIGPFAAKGLSADAVLPLAGKDLQLPVGVSYNISTQTSYSTNPGYTSEVAQFGAAPEWRINDQWRLRAIFDWTRQTQASTLPFFFTGGDYEPPRIAHVYLGQNWALGQYEGENAGAIVHGQLAEHWSLAAGLFRSNAVNPVSYSDLYLNVQPGGLADHVLVGYPDQSVASTSGEARVTGRYQVDGWRHDVVLLVRGRDTQAWYGGADSVDAGPASIGQDLQVPKPDFRYGGRVSDRTLLWSTGAAWRGQWQAHGDFALGLQRESYDKEVALPGSGPTSYADRPLRAYGQASYALAERLTGYLGATQGLEDSGTAPNGALNHGAILPDARTWQADAGARYALSKDFKVIAGVFEIEKPYFNLDTHNVDRLLGTQRAKGFETSLSGPIGKDLNLTFGTLLGEVNVLGPNLAAEGIGPLAFGQPHFQAMLNADYAFTAALSSDLTVMRFGRIPVSMDDRLVQATQTIVSVGGRYRFTIEGKAATLRVQMFNANNYYIWNFAYTPGFVQFTPRALFGYLTVDL